MSWLLAGLHGAERGWVWLYTAGIPGHAGLRRREEVAADAWEFNSWCESAEQPVLRRLRLALAQFVMGIPSDLSWRLALGRGGLAREAREELAVAMLIALGALVAVPASIFFALQENLVEPATRGTIGYAYLAHAFLVLAGLCAPAAYVIDRHPIAGAVLGTLGAMCVGLLFWWIGLLLPVAAGGAIAACATGWWRSSHGGAGNDNGGA